MVRMSAEERRESVIRAAITEFARGGYKGTSTEAIAQRVGVSQPYLFRLFPNKKAIFMAASLRCITVIRQVLEDAGRGLPADEAEEAMAAAYRRLLAEDRDQLLMQMQMYVTIAAAEADGDKEFGQTIRDAWSDQLYDFALVTHFGGDHERATLFWACGSLINTLASMGFPAEHRVWAGIWPQVRVSFEPPSAD